MKFLAAIAALVMTQGLAQGESLAPAPIERLQRPTVLAEDNPPAASTTAPVVQAAPVPQKLYFELDPQDLQTLAMGLNEVAKRLADGLLLKMNGQIQDKAWQARAAAAKEPAK